MKIKDFITFNFFNFFNFIIFFYYFGKIYSQSTNDTSNQIYEIHILFNSTGLQSIYCDDNINIFGTENINIYKIDENENKSPINSLLRKEASNFYCLSSIKYNVISTNDKIVIEFKTNPRTLKQLFSDSTIYKIERFDYPFPENDEDFNGMFYHCVELSYVDFSNFNFENTKDVNSMFYDCQKLEKVIFPTNYKASNIESFSDMFAFTTSLTSIDLSFFSFINAKNMGYMFNGCSNLKYIDFPKNEKAEKVESLSDIFAGCENLISIDLSCFNFKNVKNFAYMFNGCKNISDIKFNFEEKLSSVQNCKYMFSGCSQLTSINLSKFSFINVNDLTSMFYDCSNLEELILPQDEKATNINDLSYMFHGCEKLTSIDLSNISLVNAKQLSYMFYGCYNLTYLNFPKGEKATKIENFQNMFLFCESLISLDLSDFSFSNAKDLSGMFFYCSSLETLILPKNEIATKVEDISYMFAICFKLKTIDLSGISFAKIRNMNYLFSNCINLEKIIFPNDEEINNIEYFIYVFSNCHKLTSIDLSKFNLEKVKDLSYLFFSCIMLETIKFPTVKLNEVENFQNLFYNCTKLKSIDLSNISLSKAKNLDLMFANCESLLNIIFAKNEEIRTIDSMNGTFSNCYLLNSIDIRHFYIDKDVNLINLFSNCYSLKEIDIFNIETSKSTSTFNFLNNVYSLEGCLYYSYDNIHSLNSLTIKSCSEYMGFHKCGPCINNDNSNEYCTININGNSLNFYYIEYELNLPILERQCYWSRNSGIVAGYTFINNTDKNKISYYSDYCSYYCEICSENKFGCTKCKNNLYPIDIEYNDYINNKKSYYYCYSKANMINYYFDEDKKQFIKCSEKCKECLKGVDICNECNEEKGYYEIENLKNECWKESLLDNYVFDKEAKQWRKCNERCSKCKKQVKSELDHQCEKCTNNYYPYLIDYNNYNNKFLTGINCWTKNEVKLKNRNYFLNPLGLFEQCDNSCAECETKKDNCLECQMNYYYINEKKKWDMFS